MNRQGEEEEQVKLPTLNEFLAASGWPNNSYLDEPGFASLYVRKGTLYVVLDAVPYWCSNVLTIASVDAEDPGNGTFTKLVERLVEKGLAVYVENVHNPRFRRKLEEDLGFIPVSQRSGPNFLRNHDGHLVEV